MAEKSNANARRASEIWPSDVLLRMWPPDKVGTGMQVCRYLRCELTKVPVVVVNVEPRRGGALQAEHLARGLMRLSGHVHLQIPATLPGTQLIDILLTASTMGWTGPQSLQQALSTVRQDADKIGVEGAQKLGLFFARCLHLRHLTLSGHSIRDEGAVVLVPALLEHAAATLEGLDLRDNYLSDVSAAVFADGLPLCPKLKTLDMSDNNICVQGAEQLGSSIHKCTSLTALCMGGNNISAKGAGHLVAALAAKGSALTTLDLRGNNIWDEGVRMIADYLPRFACLQTLNLRGNKVGVPLATTLPVRSRSDPGPISFRSVCMPPPWGVTFLRGPWRSV